MLLSFTVLDALLPEQEKSRNAGEKSGRNIS